METLPPVRTRQTNIEGLADRFAPHVELLRDLFASHDLPFGSPEDTFPLAALLVTSESFHAELESILRTIIYREGMSLTRVDLLELLSIAVGGLETDGTRTDIHEPVRRLFTFINEVLRSLHRKPFEDFAAPEAAADFTGASVAEPASSEDHFVPAMLPSQPLADPGSDPVLNDVAPSEPEALFATPVTLDESVSPARDTGRRRRLAVEPVAVREPAAMPEPAPAAPPVHPQPPILRPTDRPSRARPWLLLALASCALLLAADVGLRLHHRTNTLAAADLAHPDVPSALEPAMHTEKPEAQSSPVPPTIPPATPTPAAATEQSPAATARQVVSAPGQPDAPPSPLGQNKEPAMPPATGDQEEAAIVLSSGMMTGHVLSDPAPEYPQLASLSHREGQVVLRATVSPQGTVLATQILSGDPLLRGAAEHAVRQWRYQPYLVDGRPTDVATTVTVDFRLPH